MPLRQRQEVQALLRQERLNRSLFTRTQTTCVSRVLWSNCKRLADMNSRRINWHLRHPGLAALMALLLLVAGVLSLKGVHGSHDDRDAHHHHHAGASHHHHHSDDSKTGDDCATCLYRSASVALDFVSAPLPQPEFVPVAEIAFPHSVDYAVVIVTLWSGRAPPYSPAS